MTKYLFIGFVKVFEKIPLKFLKIIFEKLAYMFSLWDRKHKEIARINMGIAFPGISRGEMDRIIRNTYRNFSWTLAEIMKIGILDDALIDQKVTFEGTEHLMDYIEKGEGVFGISGHFGNWEIMAHTFGRNFANFDILVRPQREQFINEYIYAKHRLSGNGVIEKFDSAREILRRVRGGKVIGVLMDQDTHLNRGIFVDFFGLPACTADGIARIAYMTGVKMVPVLPFRDRNDNSRHIVRFYEPVNPDVQDKEEFIRLSLKRIHEIFEDGIREQPEQWLWFHRRWRTRPPGENKIYDI
jgi:KDO2-lipid IV(A) lauroyltransferase